MPCASSSSLLDPGSRDSSSSAPSDSGCCADRPGPRRGGGAVASARRNLPEWPSPALPPQRRGERRGSGGRGPGRVPPPAAGAGWGRGGGAAFPGAIPERGTRRSRATSLAARQQVWRLRARRVSASRRICFFLASARPVWPGPLGAMPRGVILVVCFCVCTARTGKRGWGCRRDAGTRASPAAVPSAHLGVGRTWSGAPRRSGEGRGWVPRVYLPCSR